MAKKSARRSKHVPQRTCVGCRAVADKRSLVRIVRTADGVQVDPGGKLAGRGAYLHAHQDCWQKALEIHLARALRTTLTAEDRQRLAAFMETLPEGAPPEENPGD
jgi:predicted RNA-binding protein YlxR (DUF448 family)